MGQSERPNSMEQTDVPPKIRIIAGVVVSGPYTLEPSRPDYRKKRCFWRACLDGKPITNWTFTPALAVAAADRKSRSSTPLLT
jgi:hypothetical protein